MLGCACSCKASSSPVSRHHGKPVFPKRGNRRMQQVLLLRLAPLGRRAASARKADLPHDCGPLAPCLMSGTLSKIGRTLRIIRSYFWRERTTVAREKRGSTMRASDEPVSALSSALARGHHAKGQHSAGNIQSNPLPASSFRQGITRAAYHSGRHGDAARLVACHRPVPLRYILMRGNSTSRCEAF
jgi:hypothetical protein